MTKVLIATDKPFAPVAVNGIREIVEAQGYELVLLEKYTSQDELIAAVADVDAMIIRSIFWIVPAASVVALSFAWAFYRLMKREDEGTPRMREIAAHVRKGAMAYLRQQYKVVGIVFAVLALFFAWLAYGAGVQNGWVPFAFITGGFFSGLAGYFGMKTATYASARTANAARQSLDRGLKVASSVLPSGKR